MNPWPFIIAAYVFSLAAVVALLVLSWTGMTRAENEAAKLSRDREA